MIIPETDHRDGGSIELENAPMTHPAVAFAFRDAQYSTLSEARQLMDKGFALKARITIDPHTKVIPKDEARGKKPHMRQNPTSKTLSTGIRHTCPSQRHQHGGPHALGLP